MWEDQGLWPACSLTLEGVWGLRPARVAGMGTAKAGAEGMPLGSWDPCGPWLTLQGVVAFQRPGEEGRRVGDKNWVSHDRDNEGPGEGWMVFYLKVYLICLKGRVTGEDFYPLVCFPNGHDTHCWTRLKPEVLHG